MRTLRALAVTSGLCLTLLGCAGNDTDDATSEDDVARTENPFFSESHLPFQFPPFDRIDESHYRPAFEQGMAAQLAEIDAIASADAPPTVDFPDAHRPSWRVRTPEPAKDPFSPPVCWDWPRWTLFVEARPT